MIETAEFNVKVTFTTTVSFAPIERETKISHEDAIENARGQMPDEFWEMAENEGWEVEFGAHRV